MNLDKVGRRIDEYPGINPSERNIVRIVHTVRQHIHLWTKMRRKMHVMIGTSYGEYRPAVSRKYAHNDHFNRGLVDPGPEKRTGLAKATYR